MVEFIQTKMLSWTFLLAILLIWTIDGQINEKGLTTRSNSEGKEERALQGYINATELERDMFQLASGNYDTGEQIKFYQYTIEVVRYCYLKTSQHIEKFRAKGSNVLENKLKETLKFIKLLKGLVDKLKFKTITQEFSKLLVEYYVKITKRAKFIIKQNLLVAQGKPSKDWDKEDLFKIFRDTVGKSYNYLHGNISHEKIMKNINEVTDIIKDVLDDSENFEPTNIMSRYIFDGLKMITRRTFGILQYFNKGLNFHIRAKWSPRDDL